MGDNNTFDVKAAATSTKEIADSVETGSGLWLALSVLSEGAKVLKGVTTAAKAFEIITPVAQLVTIASIVSIGADIVIKCIDGNEKAAEEKAKESGEVNSETSDTENKPEVTTSEPATTTESGEPANEEKDPVLQGA